MPTITVKTGYARNFTDANLIAWVAEEWGDFPATVRVTKQWKVVEHMGGANLMPRGGEGKSLGTFRIQW